MKTTLFGASVAAILLATSAIAQTTAPAPADRAPAERPSTSAPAAPSTTAPRPTATAPAATTTANAAMSDWRASKLIGSAVYNQANERIGDINEILIDSSGKVARVVLGVGGFLGMGEHEVAVPFSDLKFQPDGSSMKVMSSYTKQSLTSMPQWRWDNSASPATPPARR